MIVTPRYLIAPHFKHRKLHVCAADIHQKWYNRHIQSFCTNEKFEIAVVPWKKPLPKQNNSSIVEN